MDYPNLLLLITDQQRQPQHWPEDPSFVDDLMPNDAELRRTGLTFTHAFCNTCMCSPSRATLFSGQYPAQHGITLTLTMGDLVPDRRRNGADVWRLAAKMAATGEVDRARLTRAFVRGMFQAGEKGGNEPELERRHQTIGHTLRDAGYHVALKGKWHLTKPVHRAWSSADTERIEREFGFADWGPPDAGENAKAENFGGGHSNWDEHYTAQIEDWLASPDLPEPWCLIVSLINPHDVLGYPAALERGGYDRSVLKEVHVPLPPTLDEDLSDKPNVHGLMRMGQIAYLGAIKDRQGMQDYVNFYAYLHHHVDQKIGRILKALGEERRERTVIIRTADHGEMGLSHGGLRQKMFNAYEETIRVPLVVSNPKLFPQARETDAFATLVDVFPTMAKLGGADISGLDVRGHDLSPLFDDPGASVRDAVHFTYDDHQAGTALANVAGQPNRVRAVRDRRLKYAVYFDPKGDAAPEYELYDLEQDPLEVHNLAGKGDPREAQMAEQLAAVAQDAGTSLP